MNITEFLLACIAEDEYDANRELLLGTSTVLTRMNARVLAECAAKRAIIEEHSPVDYSGIGMKSPNACNLCGVEKTMSDWEWDENSYPCNTLRALAAIYAGHPDYQEAWAVGG